jgi:hypothetical protein
VCSAAQPRRVARLWSHLRPNTGAQAIITEVPQRRWSPSGATEFAAQARVFRLALVAGVAGDLPSLGGELDGAASPDCFGGCGNALKFAGASD